MLIEQAILNVPVCVGVKVMILSVLLTTVSRLNAGMVTTLEHPGILLMSAVILTGMPFLNIVGYQCTFFSEVDVTYTAL